MKWLIFIISLLIAAGFHFVIWVNYMLNGDGIINNFIYDSVSKMGIQFYGPVQLFFHFIIPTIISSLLLNFLLKTLIKFFRGS